jgi:hypothetical protein
MRKLLLAFGWIISILTFVSCDDNVNPKTDFEEVYILNCIIRTDTSYQTATISSSFDINGFDPSINTTDPFIKGAKVKIFYDNAVYDFKDTAVARAADSKYKTPINIYYTNNFKPSRSLPLKIEATLPNGKTLNAESEVISVYSVYINTSNQIISENSISSKIHFSWGELMLAPNSKGVYYAPELVIFYTHDKNGVSFKKQKKVPSFYVNTDNGTLPIYPQIQSGTQSASFEVEAIKRAMAEISEGDPNKGNYKIDKAIFRLLIMDAGLASYYSLQKTFLDEFSVRVNQPDITNIKGGLGVFGTYTIKQIQITIARDFISSYGYN